MERKKEWVGKKNMDWQERKDGLKRKEGWVEKKGRMGWKERKDGLERKKGWVGKKK